MRHCARHTCKHSKKSPGSKNVDNTSPTCVLAWSTLAQASAAHLQPACLLDGDEIRRHLSRDLGFSAADRRENIRRIGQLAKIRLQEQQDVIVAAISPFRDVREQVRQEFAPGQFIEVFVDTPLNVCEQRDPKGLYRRARAGEIAEFTGIDPAYEPPLKPEIHLHPARCELSDCVQEILDYIKRAQEPV